MGTGITHKIGQSLLLASFVMLGKPEGVKLSTFTGLSPLIIPIFFSVSYFQRFKC